MTVAYVAPSIFLKSNQIKVEAGMVLDPAELGMAPHPMYGPLLTVEVIEPKADGSIFLLARATCPDCGESFELHPGDWFQKRKCNTCAKKGRRPSNKMSEEEKEAKKAERDAKSAAGKAERELKKLEEAAARAQAEAAAKQAKLEALKKEREERAALIAKVAAEKGVAVSANS